METLRKHVHKKKGTAKYITERKGEGKGLGKGREGGREGGRRKEWEFREIRGEQKGDPDLPIVHVQHKQYQHFYYKT